MERKAKFYGGPLDGEEIKTEFSKLWFRLDQLHPNSDTNFLWVKYNKFSDGSYHYEKTIATVPQEVQFKVKGIGGAEVVPQRYAKLPPSTKDDIKDFTVWSILEIPFDSKGKVR